MDERDRDPSSYQQEYRAALRKVILDLLKENNPQVVQLFKSTVKEWLDEKLKDKSALTVRFVGALLIAAVAYIIFWPKK